MLSSRLLTGSQLPTNHRVLLVEDNPDDSEVIERFLAHQPGDIRQFQVDHAGTLQEALKLCEHRTFDVVLCDVGLPDTDGTDGIAELAARDPTVPIVALTGYGDESVGHDSIQVGAEAFLTKDHLHARELRRTIAHASLRVQRRQRIQLAQAQQHRDDLAKLNDTLRLEIDGRRQAQAQLEALNEEVMRSNRDLQEFAQIASHDLKSPLRSVKTLLGWIEEDLQPAEQQQALANLHQGQRRIGRMLKMLDDLLKWASLGSSSRPKEPIDFREFIGDIWDQLEGHERFELKLNIICPIVHVYREPFELVFRNLLANAIQHHHRQHGTIKVSCEKTFVGYRLCVQDDGPGIDPGHRSHVFRLFATGATRSRSSTGVGLAMTRRAIEEQGGSIELSASERNGCQFDIYWPSS